MFPSTLSSGASGSLTVHHSRFEHCSPTKYRDFESLTVPTTTRMRYLFGVRSAKRALLWLVPLLLLTAGGYWYARSGAGQAYIDIVRGQPKYFVVTGIAFDPAALQTPELKALRKRGVNVIATGCVIESHYESYNAVIRGHFAK